MEVDNGISIFVKNVSKGTKKVFEYIQEKFKVFWTVLENKVDHYKDRNKCRYCRKISGDDKCCKKGKWPLLYHTSNKTEYSKGDHKDLQDFMNETYAMFNKMLLKFDEEGDKCFKKIFCDPLSDSASNYCGTKGGGLPHCTGLSPGPTTANPRIVTYNIPLSTFPNTCWDLQLYLIGSL